MYAYVTHAAGRQACHIGVCIVAHGAAAADAQVWCWVWAGSLGGPALICTQTTTGTYSRFYIGWHAPY